jgi:hypothetical protein
VSTVNEALIDAAFEFESAVWTSKDTAMQSGLPKRYPTVLGTGARGTKGFNAGVVWIKFDHYSSGSPPQIVVPTRQSRPKTRSNVYYQDFSLENQDSEGGQEVSIETTDGLTAHRRDSEQSVITDAQI